MKKKLVIAAVCAAGVLCSGAAFSLADYSSYAAEAGETSVTEWFSIETGASVKVDSETRGMRFATYVNAAKYAKLTESGENTVEFGTLFMAESDLGTAELTLTTANAAKVTAEKWVNNRNSVDENGNYTYMSALINLPEEYYSSNVCARSYVTINGETSYTKTVIRSYSGVALAAYADTSASYGEEMKSTLYNSYLKDKKFANLDAKSISYNAQKTSLTVIDGGKIKVSENGKNQAGNKATFIEKGAFTQGKKYFFTLNFDSVTAENCNLYLGVRGDNDEVLSIDGFGTNTYKQVSESGEISFGYTAAQNFDSLKFFLFADDVENGADYSYGYVLNSLSSRAAVEVGLSLSESSISLGTSEAGEYAASANVTATVTENGAAIASPAITWSTGNSAVATVENGTITATGVGETAITATYVSTDGEKFTQDVKVTVVKPVLTAMLTDNKLDLEADDTEEVSLSLDGIGVSADKLQKVFNKTRHNAELAFTVNNGGLVFKKAALKAGVNEFRFEFDTVIYDASVEISANVIDVVSFDAESDVSRVISGEYQLSYSTEHVRSGEIGSLKVTNSNTTANDAALTLTNAINTDMSAYDYVVFYVYNATQRNITAGTWWNGNTVCVPGEWTAVKISKGMISDASSSNCTYKAMNGFKFRFLDNDSAVSAIPVGGDVYISALKGVKVEGNVGIEFKETADLSRLSAASGCELSINTDKTYVYGEETGSLKLKNVSGVALSNDYAVQITDAYKPDLSACDYIVFYVYNATSNNIIVGTLWRSDTVCAPGVWTAVKITRNGISGFSFEDINGMCIRLIDYGQETSYKLPVDGEIYISAITGVKVEGNVGVGFNDAADLNRVSSPNGYQLSVSTEYKYGSESGSLKVKNANESATSDSYYAVQIKDSYKLNLSEFDYIVFYVYNATSGTIKVGTLWCADTDCASGKWTAVKITKDMNLTGCSFGDVNGMAIRLLSGLPAGGEIYISAITGGYNA